jgi:hypothetical protein
MTKETLITPETLLSNGFIEYEEDDEFVFDDVTYPQGMPTKNDGNRIFLEKNFHRNLFVIELLEPTLKDCDLDFNVFILEDAGCDFIEMPLRRSFLTVGILNDLYSAFMEKQLIKIDTL